MSFYAGMVQLEDTLQVIFVTRSGNNPLNAASLPTFRVYGEDGLLSTQTGSAAFKDSGVITGAANANPIVITSAAHGLATGNIVTITGVLGNTNANGTFSVTVLTADTFSIAVAGNSGYISGGAWNVTGLYKVSLTVSAANGYASGSNYTVVVQGSVNSTNWSESAIFTVV